MGNQIGKGANRMAIAAMSNVTHVEKRELASMQSKFREIASREGNPSMITRTEFTEALGIVNKELRTIYYYIVYRSRPLGSVYYLAILSPDVVSKRSYCYIPDMG